MVNFTPPGWYRLLGLVARGIAKLGNSPRLGPWETASGSTIWLHAASVGEAKGVLALLRFLPTDIPLTLTATTRDGLERLRTTGHPSFFLPLDEERAVEGFLEARRITVAVFFESEAWPCLLARLQRHDLPVAFAAFRSSRVSRRRWKRFGRLFPGWTEAVSMVWTDSVTLVGAVERLGFSRVEAGTSLKWAGVPIPPANPDESPLASAVSFHLRDFATVVDLAQTHPREGWLWFPRRPHRRRLHRLLARWAGLEVVEHTPGPGQVRISETFGETAHWLSRSRFCWVSPGHDLEEPHRKGVREVWTGRPPRRAPHAGTPSDTVASRIASWILERFQAGPAYYNGPDPEPKVDTIGNEL